MKTSLASLFLAVTLFACGPRLDSTPSADTAEIGPEGGQVTSADGRISVSIPKGALKSKQTVSVQPLEGTVPGGVGAAFKLRPEGLTFDPPATLTFHPTADDLRGTTLDELSLATQDPTTGAWKLFPHPSIDNVGGTVSIQTPHFSNWSPLAGARLFPVVATVGTTQTLSLDIEYCVVAPSDEDGIAPLAYLCSRRDYASNFSRNWSVNGNVGGNAMVGTLAEVDSGQAIYTAPAVAPSPHTVGVSVEYQDRHLPGRRGILISSVTIEDAAGWSGTVTLTENGWKQWPGEDGFSGEQVGTFGRSETVTVRGAQGVNGPSTTLALHHEASGQFTLDADERKEHWDACYAGGTPILRDLFVYSVHEKLTGAASTDETQAIYLDPDDHTYSLHIPTLAVPLAGKVPITDTYTDGCNQQTLDKSSNDDMNLPTPAPQDLELEGQVDPAHPNNLSGSLTYEAVELGVPTTVTVKWELHR